MIVNNSKKNIITFLIEDIGIEESSLKLGLKLSDINKTPLPIILWSYGILTLEELDKLYSFLFQQFE